MLLQLLRGEPRRGEAAEWQEREARSCRGRSGDGICHRPGQGKKRRQQPRRTEPASAACGLQWGARERRREREIVRERYRKSTREREHERESTREDKERERAARVDALHSRVQA